jgi:hypothetical protein
LLWTGAIWRNNSRKKNQGRRRALEDAKGASGETEFPVPATFLIDGNRTIRLARVDFDYMRRLDPDDVLETLKEFKNRNRLKINNS